MTWLTVHMTPATSSPAGLIANAAGTIKPSREVADRLHEIRTGLESSSGVQFISPSENVADEVVSVLRTLHDPDYFDALRLRPHPQEPEITELARRYAAPGRSLGRWGLPEPTVGYIDPKAWNKLNFETTKPVVEKKLLEGVYDAGVAYSRAALEHPTSSRSCRNR
ncbi:MULTISPECIES: hypothetical protein [unclassified Bradyrhizobium]|uniref:hypothetical protein n=1 Tax=unclassified Bradyrhizobium TaxID=2631580 RepID=UPI002303042A|nr:MULTISPECIES: hypothetical protein [unclassified Bradyrhizobium]